MEAEFLEKQKIQVHLIWYWYQREKYEGLVQKYGLEKHVLFRGKITGSKLIREYASSHLFVLPSHTEWFGMTIVEAMAAKTLVLSTRSGWPEDIINDGINGYLVEKNNPLKLKRKIEEICFLDIAKIDTLTRRAYRDVQATFTWDTVTAQIFTVYNFEKNEKRGKKPASFDSNHRAK
jgi:glycosyltransferase involved in cell wall biosynthesis